MAWRFEVLSLSRTLISWFEVKFDVWGGLLKLSFDLKVEVDVYNSILELRLRTEVWSLELMFDVDFCSWCSMSVLNLTSEVSFWSWYLKQELKLKFQAVISLGKNQELISRVGKKFGKIELYLPVLRLDWLEV